MNWLRRRQPALRGEGIATLSMENGARVLVFQRWVEGAGRDVIVAANLSEFTHYGYQIPMPSSGLWFEVFNSDLYENWSTRPRQWRLGSGECSGNERAVRFGIHYGAR